MFHQDGTVYLTLAGVAMPGAVWTTLENGHFQINYFDMLMEVVWTETGCDMNYFDTMLLHFVPAA